MMFSETPTVPQLLTPSSLTISTRVIAPVPYYPPLPGPSDFRRFRQVPVQETCDGMLVSHPRFLTGPGYTTYNLEAQAEAIVSELNAFQGAVPMVSGTDAKVAQRIAEVKKIQSAYWKCFRGVP